MLGSLQAFTAVTSIATIGEAAASARDSSDKGWWDLGPLHPLSSSPWHHTHLDSAPSPTPPQTQTIRHLPVLRSPHRSAPDHDPHGGQHQPIRARALQLGGVEGAGVCRGHVLGAVHHGPVCAGAFWGGFGGRREVRVGLLVTWTLCSSCTEAAAYTRRLITPTSTLLHTLHPHPQPTVQPVTAATLNYAGPLAGAVLLFALLWWLLGAHRWFDGPNTVDPLGKDDSKHMHEVQGEKSAVV